MGIDSIRKLKEMASEPREKKNYTIPKVSKKRAEKLEEQRELAKQDEEFYKGIWARSDKKCQNCQIDLQKIGYQFLHKSRFNILFHHMLPKSKYPQFRHAPENIALLCPECHSKCETNIDFAPLIKKRTEEVAKLLLNR